MYAINVDGLELKDEERVLLKFNRLMNKDLKKPFSKFVKIKKAPNKRIIESKYMLKDREDNKVEFVDKVIYQEYYVLGNPSDVPKRVFILV